MGVARRWSLVARENRDIKYETRFLGRRTRKGEIMPIGTIGNFRPVVARGGDEASVTASRGVEEGESGMLPKNEGAGLAEICSGRTLSLAGRKKLARRTIEEAMAVAGKIQMERLPPRLVNQINEALDKQCAGRLSVDREGALFALTCLYEKYRNI